MTRSEIFVSPTFLLRTCGIANPRSPLAVRLFFSYFRVVSFNIGSLYFRLHRSNPFLLCLRVVSFNLIMVLELFNLRLVCCILDVFTLVLVCSTLELFHLNLVCCNL